jgi:hypothetical protein
VVPKSGGRIKRCGVTFWQRRAGSKQLAEEADVDAVVTGSLVRVVRVGDQLRVSTQLTVVPAGTPAAEDDSALRRAV